MSPVVTDLAGIPGVPESVLTPQDAAALPATAPPPWTLKLDAILWMHAASDEALEHVPAALRSTRRLPFTVGGFVRYHDTPVGPYNEVWGSPVTLLPKGVPMGTVPFMVVDSLASVRGGRENWSLPKTMGTFAWEGDGPAHAHGDSPAGAWTVDAVARTAGPPIPALGLLYNRQAMPDGRVLRVGARARGMARMATVDVQTTGPSLPGWLLPGRHVGLVLRGATMRFGPPKVLR